MTNIKCPISFFFTQWIWRALARLWQAVQQTERVWRFPCRSRVLDQRRLHKQGTFGHSGWLQWWAAGGSLHQSKAWSLQGGCCASWVCHFTTLIIWGLFRDRCAGQMVEVWLRMSWQFILSNEDKFFGQLNINKFASFTNDYNNYRTSCWASVPGIINSYSKFKSLKQTERIKFQTKSKEMLPVRSERKKEGAKQLP